MEYSLIKSVGITVKRKSPLKDAVPSSFFWENEFFYLREKNVLEPWRQLQGRNIASFSTEENTTCFSKKGMF